MKKIGVCKRISLIAAVISFLSLAVVVPQVAKASAESPKEVYLSATGNDNGDGTESAPFATLNKAIETVADGGTIHVSGVCYVTSWSSHGKSVNITGDNPANDHLHFGNYTPDKTNITIGDNVYFSKVRLRFPTNDGTTHVYANGHTVTIAADAESPNHVYLCGGSNGGTIEGDTNLTVLAGNFKGIYGGGKGDTIKGNTNLVVGGKANSDISALTHDLVRMVYAGGKDGSVVEGSANLTFTGNAKAAYVFGGASGANTSIKNDSFLKVTGGSAVGLFGGGKGSAHDSNIHVLMTGGTVEQVFGGSHSQSVTGNVDVQIYGGTITRRIYGGCYNEYTGIWKTKGTVTRNITLSIGNNANITLESEELDVSIYGGSRLNTNNENTTIIFAGEAANTTYREKLGAQDSTMAGIMTGIDACDALKVELDTYYNNIVWWRQNNVNGTYTAYPEKDDYAFAGWFADAGYETAYTGTEGPAYAKYVDAKVLSAKKQVKTNIAHQSPTTDVRFLSSVDCGKYEKAGFEVIVAFSGGSKTFNLVETTAYGSVIADGQTISDAGSIFDNTDSRYFIAHSITGIPNEAFGGTFTVTPYWYTLDGTKVTGTPDAFTISELIPTPASETMGMNGVISDGEYKGKILDSTQGASASKDYRITVQGHITEQKNIRLAVTMDSTRDPNTVVNPDERWSKYLFGEFGFGDNNGVECTMVRADAQGNANNAITVVKTTDNGEGAEGYRYSTVMEMWISKDYITNNSTPNMVQFTRAALFHQNFANPTNVNETWLVLRSAWDNAGMNNCYVTTEGIVTTDLLAGMDGVISENEYGGKILNSNHTNQTNYKLTMQGFLQGTEMNKHSIRLAIRLDAKTAPEASVNPVTMFSDKLYVDLAFGDVDGSGERVKVNADIFGKASNAVTVVNTTDNGEGADYRYTTIIEMWIPQSSISAESHGELVWIPRLGIFHQNVENDAETWVVAKWAGLHTWLRVEKAGLNY